MSAVLGLCSAHSLSLHKHVIFHNKLFMECLGKMNDERERYHLRLHSCTFFDVARPHGASL